MLELNPDLAGASFERACEMADALHRLCESHGDPEAIKAAFDLSYMLEYLRLNPQVQEDRERLIVYHALREADLLERLDAAEKRLRDQTDWYQQRFNALRAWVNREVRPLSEEAANRYFAIVANGSPAPHEQADWRETMHGLTLRAEQAERQRDSLVAVLARLFDWEDKTYVHAVMHVENAVGNLRADLAAAKSESME